MSYVLVIVGAGAAGHFAAFQARAHFRSEKIEDHLVKIILLEKSGAPLKKVRISGGGRCNVTHNQMDPRELVLNYPRGRRELKSPFSAFNVQDTLNWFNERGVKIVAEEDGRMFPSTNTSETIIECFEKERVKSKIELQIKQGVSSITWDEASEDFSLQLNQEKLKAHSVIMATGSDKSGYRLSAELGHSITELAPSLFTFKVSDPLLKDLAGISFPCAVAEVKLEKIKLKEQGPLLITHWGLSGPAILKLSAWGAREMKRANYHFDFTINFMGKSLDDTLDALFDLKERHGQKLIANTVPENLTKRFWSRYITLFLGEKADGPWSELPHKSIQKMAQSLSRYKFKSNGQHRFKEEFVECGGISSKEIQFKFMKSKLNPNLFFAGELLDIDGVTGGFNFQNAWSTGFLAGESAAAQLVKKIEEN
jgi:predicted Rossmann fold flavoprotein